MMPPTLPDLLADDLDVVFVGINPSLYSAERGHYFARRANRFWPAFSRSRLSLGARKELGLDALAPEHDRALLGLGFGFTDLVKRATSNVAALEPGELEEAVPALLAKLDRYRPRIACFHGLTGFRPFLRAAWTINPKDRALGLQPETIGRTRVFVVPNPSPANAHFTPADQTAWYDRLVGHRRPRAQNARSA